MDEFRIEDSRGFYEYHRISIDFFFQEDTKFLKSNLRLINYHTITRYPIFQQRLKIRQYSF